MSDALMVFEPGAAPVDYAEFLGWFSAQMECREEHGYRAAVEASERLGGWLREMVKAFPSGAEQRGAGESCWLLLRTRDSTGGRCVWPRRLRVSQGA